MIWKFHAAENNPAENETENDAGTQQDDILNEFGAHSDFSLIRGRVAHHAPMTKPTLAEMEIVRNAAIILSPPYRGLEPR